MCVPNNKLEMYTQNQKIVRQEGEIWKLIITVEE